jgi:hypothetical protein
MRDSRANLTRNSRTASTPTTPAAERADEDDGQRLLGPARASSTTLQRRTCARGGKRDEALAAYDRFTSRT